MRSVRSRLAAALAVGLVAVSATACAADPPPPVRETSPTPKPNEYPDERTVYIATDSIGAGFNPHIGADQSTTTTAIAALTLPSAFDPVQTAEGVRWVRNDALIASAEVTSDEPFKVTYQIVNDAQWSDGLPVTGDDFRYLWQQMARQPNVVGQAGYRMIENVQTSGAGKVVTVTFESPYPDWRELFTNLLPSHRLRSDPTGFQTGMDSGKPLTAGPFSIYSIDRARDEVRLIRNDRYWRKPPELDQVVLRRAGTLPQTAQTFRNGDTQIGALNAGAGPAAEIGAIPGVVSNRLPAVRALTVNLNTRSTAMQSLPVRQAVLAMLNGQTVTAAAAGDDVVTPFANTVFFPSDRGYQPVQRPRPSADDVNGWLTEAGYTRGTPRTRPAADAPTDTENEPVPESGTTTGEQPADEALADIPELPYGIAPLQDEKGPLVVRIGAVNTDQRTMSAAESIADQLRSQGVRAVVRGMSNTALYSRALTGADVDLVVGWTSAGTDPAVALASQVGCIAPPAGTEEGEHTVEPKADPEVDQSVLPTPSASGRQQESTAASSEDEELPTGVTDFDNISGLCDAELIELSKRALVAEDPMTELQAAEELLAAQAVYLPIYQDTTFFAVTDAVAGVPLAGPVQVGIFGDAENWTLS